MHVWLKNTALSILEHPRSRWYMANFPIKNRIKDCDPSIFLWFGAEARGRRRMCGSQLWAAASCARAAQIKNYARPWPMLSGKWSLAIGSHTTDGYVSFLRQILENTTVSFDSVFKGVRKPNSSAQFFSFNVLPVAA